MATNKFETLEDVISYVTRTQPDKYDRWQLVVETTTEWADPVAGKAWNDDLYQLDREYYKEDMYNSHTDTIVDYGQKRTALMEAKPEQVQTSHWYLEKHSSDRWRGNRKIDLSESLGEMFAQVWSMKARYTNWPGSNPPMDYTRMTLAGILKKLGQSDISNKVKEAQEEAARKARAIKVRNQERWMAEKAAELAEAIEKYEGDRYIPNGLAETLSYLISMEKE